MWRKRGSPSVKSRSWRPWATAPCPTHGGPCGLWPQRRSWCLGRQAADPGLTCSRVSPTFPGPRSPFSLTQMPPGTLSQRLEEPSSHRLEPVEKYSSWPRSPALQTTAACSALQGRGGWRPQLCSIQTGSDKTSGTDRLCKALMAEPGGTALALSIHKNVPRHWCSGCVQGRGVKRKGLGSPEQVHSQEC